MEVPPSNQNAHYDFTDGITLLEIQFPPIKETIIHENLLDQNFKSKTKFSKIQIQNFEKKRLFYIMKFVKLIVLNKALADHNIEQGFNIHVRT